MINGNSITAQENPRRDANQKNELDETKSIIFNKQRNPQKRSPRTRIKLQRSEKERTNLRIKITAKNQKN